MSAWKWKNHDWAGSSRFTIVLNSEKKNIFASYFFPDLIYFASSFRTGKKKKIKIKKKHKKFDRPKKDQKWASYLSQAARTSILNGVFTFYGESLCCKLQFDAWLLWQQLGVSTILRSLSGISEKWGNFGSFKITESIIIFPLKLRNSHKNPANFWQGSHLHLFFVFLISFVKKKMEKCTVRLKKLKHS